MRKTIIISHLLDKYENSKHLREPGVSNKRVMLRVESAKKDFPEYDYQDASVRDAFNSSAISLEDSGLITIEWVKGRPVISCLILNLEKVMDCYCLIGRTHPKNYAIKVASTIKESLPNVKTSWIRDWRENICAAAIQEFKLPSYCQKDTSLLEDLLIAFGVYDALRGDTITIRAFSSKCYHDTKYFERNVRESFLRIARQYDSDLSLACEQSELGVRDQLAYLGIYARPELYELAGEVRIYTKAGTIDLCAAGAYGIALPSTIVDFITSINLENIGRITFIENKTNYDEYLLSEWHKDELVVYHGGFLSPHKKKLFLKIGAGMKSDCAVHFWGDIDLGGFQMYSQLQKLIPALLPMRMSGDDVRKYYQSGLTRPATYLEGLKNARNNQEFPEFEESIDEILKHGVTIEQEVFLSK